MRQAIVWSAIASVAGGVYEWTAAAPLLTLGVFAAIAACLQVADPRSVRR